MTTRDKMGAYSTYVFAQELFRTSAEILAEAQIRVAPLKGILLQKTAYDSPWDRPLVDVDILVPEARFHEVLELLRARRWECGWETEIEALAICPTTGFRLDIHRRLFPRATFRLPPEDLFSRARRDSKTFGFEVWLPDPLDTFAHLVGHFIKGRLRPDDQIHLRDFARLAETHDLDPTRCARHLKACGLDRAGRAVLGQALRLSADAATRDILQALGPDPVGIALAKLAELSATHLPPESPLGALPAHLLDRSLAAACWGLVNRAVDKSQLSPW